MDLTSEEARRRLLRLVAHQDTDELEEICEDIERESASSHGTLVEVGGADSIFESAFSVK